MLPNQPTEIEEIVRRVVARVVEERSLATQQNAARAEAIAVPPSVLQIRLGLLTLNALPSNLSGIQTIEVHPRTVVTLL